MKLVGWLSDQPATTIVPSAWTATLVPPIRGRTVGCPGRGRQDRHVAEDGGQRLVQIDAIARRVAGDVDQRAAPGPRGRLVPDANQERFEFGGCGFAGHAARLAEAAS